MTTPRYVVAFYCTAKGDGWAVADTQTGCRTSDLFENANDAATICQQRNAEAEPHMQLATIARGIGSSPSPDQLTRLHEAAARVLEGR